MIGPTQEFPQLVCPSCGRQQIGVLGDRCPHDGAGLLSAHVRAQNLNDPILGRVIADKYVVVDILGRGGMGAVYLAVQLVVGREVAIKVIRAHDAAQAEALHRRFLREAQTVARLTHDNVVTMHDFGEEPDGLLYLVLERLQGRPLDAVLRDDGPLEPERLVRLARQVLAALSDAHAMGLVHRDLKPENIFCVPGGLGGERAKVLDFGIAKLLVDAPGMDSTSTNQNLVIGTPRYMAPEQATQGEIGPATDLYALGVVLYELLSGEAPFPQPTPFAILTAHVSAPVPPLASDLDVPPALEAAIRRALAKDPRDRFADAESMAQALLDALAPGAAPIPNPADAAPRPARDLTPVLPTARPAEPTDVIQLAPRRGPVLLLTSVLAVALGAGAWWLFLRPAPESAPPAVVDIRTGPGAPTTAAPPAPPVAAIEPAIAKAAPADAGVVDAGVVDAVAADAARPDASTVKKRKRKVRRRPRRPKPRPRKPHPGGVKVEEFD